MSQLHVTQACVIQPVLDALNGSGTLKPLLRHAGLDKFNLEAAEAYLPTNAVYQFLDELSHVEHLTDISSATAEQIKVLSLAQWGEMVAFSSNILSALQFVAKYDQVIMSQQRAGFQVNGETSIFWQKYVDTPLPGREQFEFIDLALVLNGFRLAAGPDWEPQEIHLQCDTEPDLDHLLPPGSNSHIRLGQPVTGVVFPTSMLFLPMLHKDTSTRHELAIDNMEASFTKKLESLMEAFQPGFVPDVNRLSEMVNIAPRTLQRRLSDEGISLSEVIDRWRFGKSIQYLDNDQMKIREISERLGYSNASNFERAFRRWTGTSPRKFRDQH